jgi:hypothetical protein
MLQRAADLRQPFNGPCAAGRGDHIKLHPDDKFCRYVLFSHRENTRTIKPINHGTRWRGLFRPTFVLNLVRSIEARRVSIAMRDRWGEQRDVLLGGCRSKRAGLALLANSSAPGEHIWSMPIESEPEMDVCDVGSFFTRDDTKET